MYVPLETLTRRPAYHPRLAHGCSWGHPIVLSQRDTQSSRDMVVIAPWYKVRFCHHEQVKFSGHRLLTSGAPVLQQYAKLEHVAVTTQSRPVRLRGLLQQTCVWPLALQMLLSPPLPLEDWHIVAGTSEMIKASDGFMMGSWKVWGVWNEVAMLIYDDRYKGEDFDKDFLMKQELPTYILKSER